MIEERLTRKARLLSLAVLAGALAVWAALSLLRVFPESLFPSPLSVAEGFGEEIRTGRVFNDIIASLFRVATGFALAVVLGVPLGMSCSSIRRRSTRGSSAR